MARKRCFLGILVTVLVFAMMIIGCDDPNGTENYAQTVKYESKDSAGNTYILTITENTNRATYSVKVSDSYELKMISHAGETKISNGTIQSVNSGNLTLKPSSGTVTFIVIVNAGNMTGIDGTITLTNGDTVTSPSGNLTPVGTEEPNIEESTFILTDIPTRFHGMYAIVEAGNENMELYGGYEFDLSTNMEEPVLISGGSVIFPMWKYSGGPGNWELVRYYGDDTIYLEVEIWDDTTGEFFVLDFYDTPITFSNGSATKSWNDGVLFELDE